MNTGRTRLSMLTLALIIASPALSNTHSVTGSATTMLLTDFSSNSPDLGWYVLNDGVMGGRSEGDFSIVAGELQFAGRTNTNGGGFSSIRTATMQINLAAYDGIRLRIKADGRRYTWRITTDARWRGRQVSYWAEFDTAEGKWHSVAIPFSAFEPRFRGNRLDGPSLDAANITGMGLMIYDSQDGPFEICVDSVGAYSVGDSAAADIP